MVIEGWSVFLGLVAGVAVQVTAQAIERRRNRSSAKKLLKVEIDLNLDILKDLENDITKIKDLAASGDLGEHDHYINMKLFTYSAALTLINNGWFHQILKKEQIRKIYEFMNFFNQNNADSIFARIKDFREREKYSEIVRDCSYLLDRFNRNSNELLEIKEKL